MSFILDALRKSDARRQQSGAPGLSSPEPPRPPRRRRRLLPGLATAVIVLALAVTAVYLLHPDWLPLDTGESRQQALAPTSEPSSPQVEPDSGQAEQVEPLKSVASVETTTDSGTAADPEQSQAQSDRSRQRRRRRRVPSTEQEEAVVQDESRQRESAPVSAEDATEELERRMAEATSRRRETPKRLPGEPEATRQPERQASPPAEEQASEPESKALNEDVAEYVRAWELPLSVRRSLPELNLTVHVYSPNEPERFVLINGERRVAGDKIDGARIVDIRREGAVVDFQSHRFLLEPR